MIIKPIILKAYKWDAQECMAEVNSYMKFNTRNSGWIQRVAFGAEAPLSLLKFTYVYEKFPPYNHLMDRYMLRIMQLGPLVYKIEIF